MEAAKRLKELIREFVSLNSPKILADRSGIAKSHISMILTGRRKRIELDTAEKLLKGMGKTFADLDIRDSANESDPTDNEA